MSTTPFRNDGTDYHPLFMPEDVNPKPPVRIMQINVHRREAGGDISAPFPFDPDTLTDLPQLGQMYGDGVYLLTARCAGDANNKPGEIFARRIHKLKGYGPPKAMVADSDAPAHPEPQAAAQRAAFEVPGMGVIPSDPMMLLVMMMAQNAKDAREERAALERQRDEDRRREDERRAQAEERQAQRDHRSMELLVTVLQRPDPSTSLVGPLIQALAPQRGSAKQTVTEIKEMIDVAKSLTPTTDSTGDIVNALASAAAAIGPALIQANAAKEAAREQARAEREGQTIVVPAEPQQQQQPQQRQPEAENPMHASGRAPEEAVNVGSAGNG